LRPFSAGQKPLDFRIPTFLQHLLVIAGGHHGFALGVQKHPVVAAGKDACQFMGQHDNGCAQAFTQLQDQIVQEPVPSRHDSNT